MCFVGVIAFDPQYMAGICRCLLFVRLLFFVWEGEGESEVEGHIIILTYMSAICQIALTNRTEAHSNDAYSTRIKDMCSIVRILADCSW